MNTYMGVEGKAQNGKIMYVGVNGVARKVKKAYIGVNRVARLFFNSEPDSSPLIFERTIDSLASGGSNKVAALAGNYAVIKTSKFETYSSNLTHSVMSTGGNVKNSCAAASIGNYAIFIGGILSGSSTSAVDTIDGSLT